MNSYFVEDLLDLLFLAYKVQIQPPVMRYIIRLQINWTVWAFKHVLGSCRDGM